MDKNQLAIVKKNVVDVVANKVDEFVKGGELELPKNYSPANAMKSAWLMVQETEDRNHKPALEVCTQNSIANSLLKMVVQGLNPDKAQCYFIVYGKKLLLQKSYFGNMHVAKSVDPSILDIYGKTIYEEDIFEYEIKHGKEIVTTHRQKLGNIRKDKIIGAYATILYKDGRELSTVMTMDQIKQAWAMSQMKPVNDKGEIKPGSTHDKFTADMCEKTAISKVCKLVINSSDDSNVVARFAKQTGDERVEVDVEEEIESNANQDIIDVEIIDANPETGEVDTQPKSSQNIEPQEGPGF